ncbi:hypothetical protein [Bacillus sp. dmp10]|uniref:hypothetical protein n=1 Tax=Bacillus sp. dmp10 TaxID=2293321 RepID=UPI000E2F3319|nr:hypothetical protein DZB83_29945 [Bacillus sp. dmp10]
MISKSQWHHYWAYDMSFTADVNIPPDWVTAEVSLYGRAGGGATIAGIVQYRKRLDSGMDEVHEFGDWLTWTPVISDFISSITFGMANGEYQEGRAVARMDYWE